MKFKFATVLSISVLSLAFIGAGCQVKDDPAPKAERPIDPAKGKPVIKSDYVKDEISLKCKQAITISELQLNKISKIPVDQRNIENTLLAFESTMADLDENTASLTFMGYVSTNEAISAEGMACEESLNQYLVGVTTRRDLYDAIKGQAPRNPEETRLLSETLFDFEKNGLKLSDAVLGQVRDLKTKLSTLETEFSKNLNSDKSTVLFTEAELKGVSADVLKRFKKTDDGKYIVTTKSTDYTEVMQNAVVSETRRQMLSAYLNRQAKENTKLMEEAILLRQKIASLLGFETWADYRISEKMAKTSQTALTFLEGLKAKLAVRNDQDFAKLLKFKKELDPSAKTVEQWDIAFLTYQLQKRDYNLDNQKIREYFPEEVVIAGMFKVFSQILGVKYVEVTDAQTWSPAVKLYEIHEGQTDQLIGYFYTDFAPRPGKYGHAAAFTLVSGRRQADGTYNLPVASIVSNFTPAADGKPALLTHDEVETLFHEFGHIMHQTLTRAPYRSLSGANVAWDFVEAPSQMLENWVWSPQILPLISGHYLDHSQKLPQDLLEKMVAAKDFGQGNAYTKQLLYALFDLTIHTQKGPVDVTKTFMTLYRDIIGQEPIADNHFPASFGHMMGGYDGGYYGYLWSEVYAQDMFTQFPASDLTNSEVGHRYRTEILEKGNMQDAMDLLKSFLGREPNDKAFLKKLGIE